jgi:acetolactate synthase small subunit
VLALVILAGLRPVENRFFHHHRSRELSLLVERRAGSLAAIQSAVESVGQHLDRVVVLPGEAGTADRVDVILGPTPTQDLSPLLDNLRALEGVRQISSER